MSLRLGMMVNLLLNLLRLGVLLLLSLRCGLYLMLLLNVLHVLLLLQLLLELVAVGI